MRIIGIVLALLHVSASAQNITFEAQTISEYRYPLHPLNPSLKTYSVYVQELGSVLDRRQRDSLARYALVLPGYHKVDVGGDIEIEFVISPLSITKKELKDQPITIEKNGAKSTLHQYSYSIDYSFPAKIRLSARGDLVAEQDLPGFFSAEYYPQNRGSKEAIENEYRYDHYYIPGLLADRLTERKSQIRTWLSSNYGKGFVPRRVAIATVKDKKGEYEDLYPAFSQIVAAVASMNGKLNYIDDDFKVKLTNAISIYDQVLAQYSPDKKARVNKKIAGMILYNISLALTLLHQFDEAEQRLAQIQEKGNYYLSDSRFLKELIQDKRRRFAANGLIEGYASTMKGEAAPVPLHSPSSDQRHRDYVVLVTGDTVVAKFVIPPKETMPYGDSVWMQDQVIVFEDGETFTIQAKDISSYSFEGIVRETYGRIVDTRTLPFTKEYKMCKRLETGAISLYECLKVESVFNDPSQMFVRAYPYYKKDDSFEIALYGNFNKGVSKLVAEYPELSERVKNGEFMKSDLEKIVREFNAWAQKNGK